MPRRQPPRLHASYVRAGIGIAVSTIFIVLFLRNTDFSSVADAFRRADALLILAGLAAYFLGVAMRTARWHYLLRPHAVIPSMKLLPIVAIGYGTNNVLPFRTGEIVRTHVLQRRHGIPISTGLSSVFLERVFDGMMLAIFLCVGVGASLAHFEGMPYAGDLLLATMAFLIFGVSMAFLILNRAAADPAAAERIVRRAASTIPLLRRGNLAWLPSLITGVEAAADRRLLLAGAWTSAVAWGLEAFMYYLIGEAFGLDQPFPVYLLIAAAANILITAPSTSGGVGPFEWAAKEVLLIFLVAENADAIAIAYAASLHGLVLIPIAIVGLLFLWLSEIPLRRWVRGESSIPSAQTDHTPNPPAH